LTRGKPPERPFGWRFVAPLLVGASLNPINSSIIATALVAIGAAFRVGPGQSASLVAIVYLASAVAQPAMGKLSTRFGSRRVLLSGMTIVVLAAVIGAFAPSFGWLLVSRLLIGIGTSAGYPTAMALIKERADRTGSGVPGSVLGSLSIAAQLTIALGLPIGGVLIGLWGWRAVFLVNVPVGLIGILATLAWIPKDSKETARRGESLATSLDPLGLLLFAAAVTSLLAFLSDLRSPTWWLLGAFAAAVVVLAWWERRAMRPFLDVRMLAANAPLVRTYLRNCLTLAATYAVLYGFSQWMEQARGLSPTTVGLLLLPMTAIGAVVSAVIARRNLVKVPLVLAGVSILVGAVVLMFVDTTAGIVLLIGVSLIFGLTTGFGGIGNQAALYSQSDAGDIAVASGLLRTSNYIGAILASSLITLAFGASATDTGLHTIAYVFGALGAVVMLMGWLDRAIPRLAQA